MQQYLSTQYAPAERASLDALQDSIQELSTDAKLKALVDAVPNILIVLNQERQVVFYNAALLDLLESEDGNEAYGQRPGELLGCVHASETAGGCGTTEFCSTCGAVKAILTSLEGKRNIQTCRIMLKNGGALDLRVWATPYQGEGQVYSIFTVIDISHEQRRRALERIFFHDVLNTAGGLRGFAELMQDSTPEEIDELSETVLEISEELINEIQAQRDLASAESGDLQIKKTEVHPVRFLEELKGLYSNHEVAKGKTIEIEKADVVKICTDRVQLRRVVGNMLKNALEAIQPGQVVRIGGAKVTEDHGGYRFWVRNPGWIPREIQLQLFQRSFSTKGQNRGLGTYSIKLLGEKYLNGEVGFASTQEKGTVFWLWLPELQE
jgi:nitrogen fixation/metabolism regulation signal transduction histidine kinase